MSGTLPPRTTRAGSREDPLPPRLARLVDYGLYALALGLALLGTAFLTNPVPDPSFPWATLPPSMRLPYVQPRVEHWPVTYTAGIWLWVLAFPALFLEGYRRYAPRTTRAPSLWFVGLPAVAMLGWTTYCRFFWPKLQPPTWNAPSYTAVCWLYCSSYDPVWSNLTYLVGLVGAGGAVLAYRDSRWATGALATFGLLAVPLGVPALYEAYRRHTA